jgi:hypothetical protein
MHERLMELALVQAVPDQHVEHMEAKGDLKTSCCWAGSVAADKWMDIKKEA